MAVRLQITNPAPGKQFIDIDQDFDKFHILSVALSPELIKASIGKFQPLLIASGKLVAVGADFPAVSFLGVALGEKPVFDSLAGS